MQIQTEKWLKVAISNYAMLIMYAATHASVLKEEDIARPPSYFQCIIKAICSSTLGDRTYAFVLIATAALPPRIPHGIH